MTPSGQGASRGRVWHILSVPLTWILPTWPTEELKSLCAVEGRTLTTVRDKDTHNVLWMPVWLPVPHPTGPIYSSTLPSALRPTLSQVRALSTTSVSKTSVPQEWGPTFPQDSRRHPQGSPTCAQAWPSSSWAAPQSTASHIFLDLLATDILTVWAILVTSPHSLSAKLPIHCLSKSQLFSQMLNLGFA